MPSVAPFVRVVRHRVPISDMQLVLVLDLTCVYIKYSDRLHKVGA
jgi:hypothetical protein